MSNCHNGINRFLSKSETRCAQNHRVWGKKKKKNLSRVNGSIFRKELGRAAWHRSFKLFSTVSKPRLPEEIKRQPTFPQEHPIRVRASQPLTEESAPSPSLHLRHGSSFPPHQHLGCRLCSISPALGLKLEPRQAESDCDLCQSWPRAPAVGCLAVTQPKQTSGITVP